MKQKLILASASPRRRELLEPFYDLKVKAAHIDESPLKNESPRIYVKRVALEKWRTVAAKNLNQNAAILAADTIVVLKNKILGKPKNKLDAARMLTQLAGNKHHVMTAVVMGYASQKPKVVLSNTEIKFRPLALREIKNYILSKEWEGKAGSYAIQGKAMTFVERINGSLTNVIGLPLEHILW